MYGYIYICIIICTYVCMYMYIQFSLAPIPNVVMFLKTPLRRPIRGHCCLFV